MARPGRKPRGLSQSEQSGVSIPVRTGSLHPAPKWQEVSKSTFGHTSAPEVTGTRTIQKPRLWIMTTMAAHTFGARYRKRCAWCGLHISSDRAYRYLTCSEGCKLARFQQWVRDGRPEHPRSRKETRTVKEGA